MFLSKVALIAALVSFTQVAQAKLPAATISVAHEAYLAEKKVLFFIGRHIHSDRIAIWSRTALTEDMVKLLLERPKDMEAMAALLKSKVKYWRGNGRLSNYRLDNFFVDKEWQGQKILKAVARDTQGLQVFDGYIDYIEEVDGFAKFFNNQSKEVLPEEKTTRYGARCVISTGEEACKLLYTGFVGYDKNLTTSERSILNYFVDNIDALKGVGIKISHMAEELGISSVWLGRTITKVQAKLADDHFVHNVKMLQLSDGKFYYRLRRGKFYFIEQRIIDYFESNIESVDNNGIAVATVAAEFGLSHAALGAVIRHLKNKLDKNHFIQKISFDLNKKVYHFYKGSMPQRIVAYFEKNIDNLQGEGVDIDKMAAALDLIPTALKRRVGYMQGRLDSDHLINQIKVEQGYFRFLDGGEKIIKSAKNKEAQILAYLKENIAILEGDGLAIATIVAEFDVNAQSLGWALKRLQKELDADHFVQQIGKVYRNGKMYYRLFAERPDSTEQLVLKHLKDNEHMLHGEGIKAAAMAAELSMHSVGLGQRISGLQRKLDKDHSMQKIKVAVIRGATFYRYSDDKNSN